VTPLRKSGSRASPVGCARMHGCHELVDCKEEEKGRKKGAEKRQRELTDDEAELEFEEGGRRRKKRKKRRTREMSARMKPMQIQPPRHKKGPASGECES